MNSSITSEVVNEIKKRPRWKNFKKWVSGIACGALSILTCCMCCACCGTLRSPNSLVDVDDEEKFEEQYQRANPTDKKTINVTNWCGLSCLSLSSIPSCCGCCCGCCGVISPSEFAIIINKK
jgi:hypothetical protein